MSIDTFDNIELHAYVDGELTVEDRRRVEDALKSNSDIAERIRSIHELKNNVSSAFAERQPANVPQRLLDAVETKNVAKPLLPSLWATAACLLIGLTGGFFLGQSGYELRNSSVTQDWIAQVANYQDMYTLETLAHVKSSAIDQESTLNRLSATLERELVIPEFKNTAIEFKRGQILSSNASTVIQLAFLNEQTGVPVAVCLSKTQKNNQPLHNGQAFGTNYVNWRTDGLDFLVIGKLSHAQLNELATETRDQFNTLQSNTL